MSLAKVTIEPANACNLDCSTWMRKAWEEPLGIVTRHTFELLGQVLYAKSMYRLGLEPSDMIDEAILPRMDLDIKNVRIILDVLKRNQYKFQISRQPIRLGENSCPFIEQGSISIRWDGAVSPYLPLMHTHNSFLV